MNSQPDISGQFVLENDSIYLRLNSSLIFSNGSMVVPTENSKDMVDIKTNDYITSNKVPDNAQIKI